MMKVVTIVGIACLAVLNCLFSVSTAEVANLKRGRGFGFGAPLNPRSSSTRVLVRPESIDPSKAPKLPGARFTESAPGSGKEERCNTANIVAASGDELVQLVVRESSNCILNLFSLTDEDVGKAFNNADMVTIAYDFYSAAYYYNPLKPADGSLLQFVLYLRAGLYLHESWPDETGEYDEELYAFIEHGERFFFAQPNLDHEDDVHLETFAETITLIINAHLNLELIDEVSNMLQNIADWSWSMLEWDHGNVVNWLFNVYWRLTWETEANDQLPDKPHVALSLDYFMTKRQSLLDGSSEWLLANCGSELARLMQFSSIKSSVSQLVEAQINRYSLTEGTKVWIAMASQIEMYDNENCDLYETCGWKESAIAVILPHTAVCPKTKNDQFTIRAQLISEAQIEEVCGRLKSHELYFHDRLATNWAPVKDDFNWRLDVVIYASSDDYRSYNWALFGYDTNNGGIYIEGDPANEDNEGQFFCYVQHDWDGKWDVWNLEHEITHYFDGRYDLYGDFYLTYSYPTVWWAEGLGEYMANKNDYYMVQRVCTDKLYPLSSIFTTRYEDGTAKTYYYGYASSRFMFERHWSDVQQILALFRSGKFDEYKKYLTDTLGTKYDAEFSTWCDCIAKDYSKPC